MGKFSGDNSRVLGVEVPLTGSSFLITYDGTVQAGMRNFEDVNVTVDDAAQTIRADELFANHIRALTEGSQLDGSPSR